MEFHRGVCPFAWKVVDHSQPLVFHEAGDECAAGVMITHLASNTRGQAAARAWVGAEASAPSAASAAWGVLEAWTTSEAAVHQEVFSCEAPIPSLAPIKSVRGRAPAEADDIAVGILDVEVLRAPRRRREWFDDPCAIRCALCVKRLDAINAGCCVQMLVLTPVQALSVVLGRFL